MPSAACRRVVVLLVAGGLIVAACGDTDDTAGSAADAAVRVEAEGCGQHTVVGGGAFVDEHLVITVAHVVAGADEVEVVLPDRSEHEAVVVAIDRRSDLAVLDVDQDVAPLALGRMRAGTRGEFVSWRSGAPIVERFVARSYVDVEGADIDGLEPSPRRAYEIRAHVEPGDSGTVLVTDGKAVAVVFARSERHRERAWAIDITEATDLIDAAEDADGTPVDLGECTAD